jgi:hypothetical protein
MLKTFSAAILVALAQAQNSTVTGNATVTPFDDTPSNPNCTTGNALACNRADGFWDYNDCTCTFAPVAPAGEVAPEVDEEEIEAAEEAYEQEAEEIDAILEAMPENKKISSDFGKMAFFNVIVASIMNAWMYETGDISLGRGKKGSKGKNTSGENNWAFAGQAYYDFWANNFFLWALYHRFGWGWAETLFRWSLKWSPFNGTIVSILFLAIPFTGRFSDKGVWAITFSSFLLSWRYMFKHRQNMLDEMEGYEIIEEAQALEEQDPDFLDYGDLPPEDDARL